MNQEYFPTSIKSFIKDCEDSGLKEQSPDETHCQFTFGLDNVTQLAWVVYKQTIALWHTVTFEDKGRFTVSEEDLDLSSTVNTHAGLVCIYHEEGGQHTCLLAANERNLIRYWFDLKPSLYRDLYLPENLSQDFLKWSFLKKCSFPQDKQTIFHGTPSGYKATSEIRGFLACFSNGDIYVLPTPRKLLQVKKDFRFTPLPHGAGHGYTSPIFNLVSNLFSLGRFGASSSELLRVFVEPVLFEEEYYVNVISVYSRRAEHLILNANLQAISLEETDFKGLFSVDPAAILDFCRTKKGFSCLCKTGKLFKHIFLDDRFCPTGEEFLLASLDDSSQQKILVLDDLISKYELTNAFGATPECYGVSYMGSKSCARDLFCRLYVSQEPNQKPPFALWSIQPETGSLFSSMAASLSNDDSTVAPSLRSVSSLSSLHCDTPELSLLLRHRLALLIEEVQNDLNTALRCPPPRRKNSVFLSQFCSLYDLYEKLHASSVLRTYILSDGRNAFEFLREQKPNAVSYFEPQADDPAFDRSVFTLLRDVQERQRESVEFVVPLCELIAYVAEKSLELLDKQLSLFFPAELHLRVKMFLVESSKRRVFYQTFIGLLDEQIAFICSAGCQKLAIRNELIGFLHRLSACRLELNRLELLKDLRADIRKETLELLIQTSIAASLPCAPVLDLAKTFRHFETIIEYFFGEKSSSVSLKSVYALQQYLADPLLGGNNAPFSINVVEDDFTFKLFDWLYTRGHYELLLQAAEDDALNSLLSHKLGGSTRPLSDRLVAYFALFEADHQGRDRISWLHQLHRRDYRTAYATLYFLQQNQRCVVERKHVVDMCRLVWAAQNESDKQEDDVVELRTTQLFLDALLSIGAKHVYEDGETLNGTDWQKSVLDDCRRKLTGDYTALLASAPDLLARADLTRPEHVEDYMHHWLLLLDLSSAEQLPAGFREEQTSLTWRAVVACDADVFLKSPADYESDHELESVFKRTLFCNLAEPSYNGGIHCPPSDLGFFFYFGISKEVATTAYELFLELFRDV